jgi:hypothetical protein
MAKESVSLAIIGCGFVAQQAHLPCFASNELFDIKCIADPYQDLAMTVANKYAVPRLAKSHLEVCDMEDIEAVVVTLPRKLTASVVQDLADAGKQILAEKPISLNSDTKKRLIAACEEKNASVMTGYMRQHDTGTQNYKALLKELNYSEIISIFAYCHMGDSYASPFGDKKGSELHKIDYTHQALPLWLDETKYYAFEQFINVFSHITHTLEYVFERDLEISAFNVNQMGEGHILCRLGEIGCALELIRGTQVPWREGIKSLFRNQQVIIEFTPAFLQNQSAVVRHFSHDGGIRQLPLSWSWAFRNQSYAFYKFIHSSNDFKLKDLLRAFSQVEFAEKLFQAL